LRRINTLHFEEQNLEAIGDPSSEDKVHNAINQMPFFNAFELLDPPNLASMMAAACSMFSGKEFRPLGFSH
jgi:hypothetical protein